MIPIPAFPLNLSVKGYFSQTNLSFSQTDSGVTGDIDYENSMYGLLAQGSVSLLIIEPYLGIGWQSSEGKLKSTLSNVFDPSLTAGTSATSEIDGTYFQVGFNFLIWAFGPKIKFFDITLDLKVVKVHFGLI